MRPARESNARLPAAIAISLRYDELSALHYICFIVPCFESVVLVLLAMLKVVVILILFLTGEESELVVLFNTITTLSRSSYSET